MRSSSEQRRQGIGLQVPGSGMGTSRRAPRVCLSRRLPASANHPAGAVSQRRAAGCSPILRLQVTRARCDTLR